MKMIALVSDQRMQNVIPLLQEGCSYDELVLVLSKDRRAQKPLSKYTKSAADLTAALQSVCGSQLLVVTSNDWVDPFSIEAVAATIGKLINQGDAQSNVVVNISGGTKPMAIGALQAAQTANVPCLYTNTEDNELIWLFPDGSTRIESIKVKKLDVPVYIQAYGEQVITYQKVSDLPPNLITWAGMIADNHRIIYQEVIYSVMKAIQVAQNNPPICCHLPKTTKRQRVLIEQMAKEGLWDWDNTISQITLSDKDQINFINGGWVEVYVAYLVEKSGYFDDVCLNVKLSGVEGEIDVAAVGNSRLIIIECKSNVQRSEQLSKLDSFRRRLGGPFAHAYYARASDAYQAQIKKQCRKFHLNGEFFGAELCQIGTKIGELVNPT